ncbi:MAG: hypothetical protein V4555_06600 [Acidobacteriota bacterium]
MTIRRVIFGFAVPLCLYICFFGIGFMGFCPGWECFPHTFAWILAAPLLLIAIWSLRFAALAMVALLCVHVAVDVAQSGFSVNTLWGTDQGLDVALWAAVLLVAVAALIPARTPKTSETALGDSL